jgi:hypothetical protein
MLQDAGHYRVLPAGGAFLQVAAQREAISPRKVPLVYQAVSALMG